MSRVDNGQLPSPKWARVWRSELSALSLLVSADVVSRVLGQAALLVTARLIGPTEYGSLGAALAIFSVALVISDLGIGEASVQRLTTRQGSEETFRREVAGTRIMVSTAAMTIGLVAFHWLDGPMENASLLLTALPFAVAITNRTYLGRIQSCFGVAAAWTSVLLLCQWIGSLLGAVAGGSARTSLISVIASLALISLPGLMRDLKRPPRFANILPWIRRGLPFTSTAIAVALYSRGDRIIVAVILGATQAGIYIAAYSVIMITAIGGSAIQAAVLPRLIRELKEGTIPWVGRAAFLGAISAPVAILLALTGPRLVSLAFGDAYVSGGRILQLLSPLVVFYLINPFLSSCLIAAGRQGALARVAFINLCLAACLYPIMASTLGLEWLAVCSVAVELIGSLQMMWILHHAPRAPSQASWAPLDPG